MVVCVNCGRWCEFLFREFSRDRIALVECDRCKKCVDFYFECTLFYCILDFMLLRPSAFRHLFYNYLPFRPISAFPLIMFTFLVGICEGAYYFLSSKEFLEFDIFYLSNAFSNYLPSPVSSISFPFLYFMSLAKLASDSILTNFQCLLSSLPSLSTLLRFNNVNDDDLTISIFESLSFQFASKAVFLTLMHMFFILQIIQLATLENKNKINYYTCISICVLIQFLRFFHFLAIIINNQMELSIFYRLFTCGYVFWSYSTFLSICVLEEKRAVTKRATLLILLLLLEVLRSLFVKNIIFPSSYGNIPQPFFV